jgi:hypothetical protein
MSETKLNNIPNILPKRNEFGLLESTNYVFKDDGLVNWRVMIPSEFLVPNTSKTEEKDISKLKDNELIILLGGIRYLASLRGFNNINYIVNTNSPDYVCITCCISWQPNFETQNTIISYSAVAAASRENTNGFGQYYLAEIASNRAFCRAVRNFLDINIVSKEELNDKGEIAESSNNNNGQEGLDLLSSLMIEKRISFEKIKEKLIQEQVENAKTFESIKDLPKIKILDLIERLKKINIKT